MKDSDQFDLLDEIAVIGMACRFPGARNIDEFWSNLREGVESVSFFSNEELVSAGIDPAVVRNPNYIKAGAVLESTDQFDASFFAFTPREAEIMDPQHRIFLECAWEALESAGYDPDQYQGRIGMFAGVGINTYLSSRASLDRDSSADVFQLAIANEKDHLTTRASYKFNLRGPAISVSTACSTSLVAIHLACQSLLNGECDMSLAGGVSIRFPQKTGYLYQTEGIISPDGHCRAFDAGAQGTVPGNGAGIVVLMRLADALRNGACIQAVIKGSAVNNDGSQRVGYAAPGVQGQSQVIMQALAAAAVEPETITYVETHGTGTPLGDPIEIAALTKAFRARMQTKGTCAIGSVKTNLGHLDAAAGVAGFIKTVLALKHRLLPPSLHFERPNPEIDFANSPFYVNTTLSPWEAGSTPRRAGVSSFGLGGTNAHIILEEAPITEGDGQARPWHLLLLSARTDAALSTATSNLTEHFKQHPSLNLADVAYTLQVGRKAFGYRQAIVSQDLEDAGRVLKTLDPLRALKAFSETNDRSIAFLFPGVGDHYLHMAWGLYQTEPIFRTQVDRCSEILKPYLGLDLRDILYPDNWRFPEKSRDTDQQLLSLSLGFDLRKMLHLEEDSSEDDTPQPLNETWLTQPAVFVIEYALACLWIEWIGYPKAMIGYSIGEYVAACVAGVLSLEDALFLIAKRARMIHELPGGTMIAVSLPEEEVQALPGEQRSLSAVNAPSLCVVSGPDEAMAELERELTTREISYRKLQASHAFHSQMMYPIVDSFVELLKTIQLNPPKIPYLSNVTGTWITPAQAVDPHYWARHLCQTVRFADGIRELLSSPVHILLEVGPGQTLSTLTLQNVKAESPMEQVILPSLRYAFEPQSDTAFLLGTLARLWLVGAQIDWSRFYARERRHRIPLPTYPFERQRYWIESQATHISTEQRPQTRRTNIADWFYLPSWKRTLFCPPIESKNLTSQRQCWLVFVDEWGIGSQIVKHLEYRDQDVVTVFAGDKFSKSPDGAYTLRLRERNDYTSLLEDLRTLKRLPNTIVHCWSVTSSDEVTSTSIEGVKETQHTGFYSLLFLAQALGAHNVTDPLQIRVVSNHVHSVESVDLLDPGKMTLLGLCKVIPQEYTNITCQNLDITLPETGSQDEQRLVDQIVEELQAPLVDRVIAYRGNHRWIEIFEPLPLGGASEPSARLRKEGVYLITGGLGMIGLILAGWLARSVQARLVLINRSSLPARAEWQRWLTTHEKNDGVSASIRKIQELEDLGAEVEVMSADVADIIQMQIVVDQTLERFGKLHGVIHAAGLPGEKYLLSIQELDYAECESQFRAKVYGTLVLEEVLHACEIDFCLLLSSLSSVLGGLQYSAYTSANLFLDAYAHKHNQTHHAPWISVDWDGATPQETIDAIQRILSVMALERVVVSTSDLHARLDRWIALTPSGEAGGECVQSTISPTHHSRPHLQTTYVGSTNEVEQTIADIWQTVIGIEQVGIYDNFFALGGHSLLATQIVTRLRKIFQLDVSLRTFLEKPTVAELATAIMQMQVKQASNGKQTAETPSLVPVSRAQDLPLSFAQQRLWFLDQLEPGNTAYNVPICVELRGMLHAEALERSLAEIVRRHEVLRTTFGLKNSQPVQNINSINAVGLPLADLSGLALEHSQTEMHRLEPQKTQQPFDLAHGPLLRATLLRLERHVHVLLMTFHHIVIDDRSISVFIQELAALYESQSSEKQKPSLLPSLPVQYADFAVWQRSWLKGEVLQAQLSYWKQQLAGAATLEFPTDRPRPSVRSFRGVAYRFVLSKTLSSSLRTLSQREGVTLFMTLLTVFEVLLYYYTQQDDIVVGSPIANRTQMEVEGLIGFFVNTLVLRTSVSGNPSFLELLKRVRETALGAYAHQDVPFEELVQSLSLERDLSRNPLFQILFSLHDILIPPLELPNLSLRHLESSIEVVRYDLALHILEADQELMGAIVYNTGLFEADVIQHMVEHLKTLLDTVVTQNDAKISTLVEILAAADETYLLTKETEYKKTAHQKLRSTRRKGFSTSAVIGENI